MNYSINHTTTYIYFEPVSLCHNIIKLLPRDTDKQVCGNITVKITPQPDKLDEYEDFFGNKVIYFSIEKEHRQLTVDVISSIEKKSLYTQEISSSSDSIEEVQQALLASNDVRQYIFETPMTSWNKEIEEYARRSFTPGRSAFEATEELMHRIYTDFEFKPGFTTIATPLSVVMQ
ncbi:MAG: transglutaminase N-terminal domain-containing protein, partial [Chitinophagaceae bacterium]